MIGGFSCQAFSIAGYHKGFHDEKGQGDLFFELARLIDEKRPRVALFENVKNLVSIDNGNTLQRVCKKAHDFNRGMNCQPVNVATKSNYLSFYSTVENIS